MFSLILGPMKSGKSLELIARVAPNEYAGRRVRYVQPKANVRDTGVQSRLGIGVNAQQTDSLSKVLDSFDTIGIDEIHMFPESDVAVISQWISSGKDVFISGLDLDYRGVVPPIVTLLYQLKPDEVTFKRAVCDVCTRYDAIFTQILYKGELVLEGIPMISPEDGTLEYQARCRECFIRK